MTNQIKAIEQYLHVVLFKMLYNAALTLNFSMKPEYLTIQMKAIEQYFHMVLFIMLHKVLLTF